MKKIFGVLLLMILLSTGVCIAGPEIPNLVGTWEVQSEAGLITKDSETGIWTHHRQEFSTLTAELVVTKQQGRVLYATFTSKHATEKMAAVIGWDNKTVYLLIRMVLLMQPLSAKIRLLAFTGMWGIKILWWQQVSGHVKNRANIIKIYLIKSRLFGF